MLYCKDEFVMYAANGVCRVVDIRDEAFSGESRTYYVLMPLGTASHVYVPVDSQALTERMRPLLSFGEIEEAISEAKAAKWEWIDDTRARGQHFQEIISRGDTRELLSMVYAIYARREEMITLGKKNLMVDENALKKAEKILFGELSVVLGIALADVGAYLK